MKTAEKNIIIYYLRKVIETHDAADDSMYLVALQMLPAKQRKQLADKYYKKHNNCTLRDLAFQFEHNNKIHRSLNRSLLSILPHNRFSVLTKIKEISQIFNLSGMETELLQLSYLTRLDNCFDDMIGRCYNDEETAYAIITNSSRGEIVAALGGESRLKANHLLSGYNKISMIQFLVIYKTNQIRCLSIAAGQYRQNMNSLPSRMIKKK